MADTYDAKQAKAKDRVRFMIRDTRTPFVLCDAEIQAVIDREANLYLAAAACGEAIIANDRGMTNITVDRVSITKGQFGGEAYATLISKYFELGCQELLNSSGKPALLEVL